MIAATARVAEGLSRLTDAISALLLAAVVLINVAQVVFRYLIGDPLGWTEEVMRYSIIWVTFLAATAATYRGEHMVIDPLGHFLPEAPRRVLHLIVLVCVGAFCWLLIWEGFPLALRNAAQTSPSARIPMIIPYVSVAVGGALILIQALCLMVLIAAGRDTPAGSSGS